MNQAIPLRLRILLIKTACLPHFIKDPVSWIYFYNTAFPNLITENCMDSQIKLEYYKSKYKNCGGRHDPRAYKPPPVTFDPALRLSPTSPYHVTGGNIAIIDMKDMISILLIFRKVASLLTGVFVASTREQG